MGQVVHVHTGNLNAPGSPSSALVVVGVARDVQISPNLAPRLNLYVPMQQKYVSGITILARTTGPTSVADDIRAVVTSMNPNLPVLIAQTLDSLGRGPVEAQLRVAATVAGSVGLIGLLLAAMGIYGVTAYTVARRTREIGIRLSLGAGRSAVVGMILRQGMTLVGIGLANRVGPQRRCRPHARRAAFRHHRAGRGDLRRSDDAVRRRRVDRVLRAPAAGRSHRRHGRASLRVNL